MADYPVLGIDTSHHQDESSSDPLPDFAMGADQYAFDIVKVTDGWKYGLPRPGLEDYQDPEFQYAYHELKVIGKPRGVYHFFRTDKDTRKQAEAVALAITQAGSLPEMGVWCDVERNDGNLKISAFRAALEKFCNIIDQELGCMGGFYTRKLLWDAWIANPTNGASDLAKRPLWVANYGVTRPAIPWDWEQRGFSWKFWQPGTMNMPGFKSPIDYNYYNGSVEDFEKEFDVEIGPITPPPPPPPPPDTMPVSVKIRGLLAGETLRMRNSIFGTVAAMTWNGAEFDVIGQAKDPQGRWWYQLGPSIWVASWYCETV